MRPRGPHEIDTQMGHSPQGHSDPQRPDCTARSGLVVAETASLSGVPTLQKIIAASGLSQFDSTKKEKGATDAKSSVFRSSTRSLGLTSGRSQQDFEHAEPVAVD
jgi:hypothetical protein